MFFQTSIDFIGLGTHFLHNHCFVFDEHSLLIVDTFSLRKRWCKWLVQWHKVKKIKATNFVFFCLRNAFIMLLLRLASWSLRSVCSLQSMVIKKKCWTENLVNKVLWKILYKDLGNFLIHWSGQALWTNSPTNTNEPEFMMNTHWPV